MNEFVLVDAIGCLGADLLEEHLEKKEKLRGRVRKQKKMQLFRWAAAAAACFLLIVSASIGYQYIPTRYELDYSYIGSNGENINIADENVWIYYVDGTGIKRERVTVPCTAENVFITWKHLNGIGDEVKLISFKIVSNGIESSFELMGENVTSYKPGDWFAVNITISENIKNYGHGGKYDALMQSLKRSMTEYSGIDFDEVNIILE